MQHASQTTASSAGRTAAAIAAAVTAAAALAACAEAEPDFLEETQQEGLFYGNADEAVALFAGATAVEFCDDEQPVFDAKLYEFEDGSTRLEIEPSPASLYLYDTPLEPPEFLNETCTALFDRDEGTIPLEPFATGEGELRNIIDTAADGTVEVSNTSSGTVTAEDGSTIDVVGTADLMIVDGQLVGSPDEFQSLQLERTGS